MAAIVFDIDPVHTFLGFGVRYLGISRVDGRFTRVGGMLELDWDDLTRSAAHLRIEADRDRRRGAARRREPRVEEVTVMSKRVDHK